MKINKIVFDIRERLSLYQDDSNITNEYLIYLIGIYREKMLKNEMNNYQTIVSPLNTQSFCMPLEEVSAFTCGMELDCETIVRTKFPIPNPIKYLGGVGITAVRLADRRSKPLAKIDREAVPYFLHAKFRNGIYYFIDSDMHLYFLSKNDCINFIPCVYITGIFSDPLELEDFNFECVDCNEGETTPKCYDPLESDYPLTGDLVTDVVGLIQEMLTSSLNISEDKHNNADDTKFEQ